MLQFKKNTEERKTLATRLGELTGIHPVYTRAPHYAYQIGDYWIDRDGNLTVEEDKADMEVLETLLGEGMILPVEDDAPEQPEQEEMEEATVDAPSGEAAEESEEETEEETEDEAADEAAEEPADETEYGTEDEAEDEAVEVDTAESADLADAEGADYAEVDTATDADSEDEAAGEDDLHANFNLPLEQHTGLSLRNLFHLIYSRGPILNKATGGNFRVEQSLVDALSDDACIQSVETFRTALDRYEAQHGRGYEGIELGERWLTFSGFGLSADADHLRAYGQLAALMHQMAISQKRIQAKEVTIDNEKYAFRVWLIRLGMNGEEYKQARKLLMENLSGHAAFRTNEEAEKAKQKAQEKRRAARERDETPQADTDAAAGQGAAQPDTAAQVGEAQPDADEPDADEPDAVAQPDAETQEAEAV